MVVVTVPPKSVARAMVYRGSVESLLAERRVGTRKIIARVVVVSQRTGYGLSGRETHVKLSVDTKSEKAGPADWWPLSWHYSERRSSTTKYLHAGLKNADLQTNSSQTNTGTRRYDAFGNIVGGVGSYGGPFGYAGKFGYQSSEDSGLMLLGHRYYDSTTGRFLTRDPIKDGRNWYGYCQNASLTSVDPAGLFDERVWRIIREHLGKDAGDRYKNDPPYRDRVHEEIQDRKIPGPGRDNPDLDEEDVREAAEDAWQFAPSFNPVFGYDGLLPEQCPVHYGSFDWAHAATVVAVAGVIVLTRGRGATPTLRLGLKLCY